MGVLVEVFHDEKGMVWPKQVAPFDVHLITLGEQHHKRAEEIIKQLESKGIDVLWDDREDVSAGQKFADCDLIGIPVRLVLSDKTLDKIEFKKRESHETKLISPEELDI